MRRRRAKPHPPRKRFLALTLAAGAALGGSSPWVLNAAAEEGGVVLAPTPPTSSAIGIHVDEVAAWATGHWKSRGYGQVSVDYAAATVRILWKGEPPADVVAREGMGADGVNVEITQSKYSQDDLEAAGGKLLASYRGTVVSSQRTKTMDGIVVTFDPAIASTRGQIIDADQLSEAVGLPVTLEAGEAFSDAILGSDSGLWEALP